MKKYLLISFILSFLWAIEVTDEGRVVFLNKNEDFKLYFTKIYNFSTRSVIVNIEKKMLESADGDIDSLEIANKTIVIPEKSYANLALKLQPRKKGDYRFQLNFTEKNSTQSFLLPVVFVKD